MFASHWKHQLSSSNFHGDGAEIDLLLGEYGAITLCEIKYTAEPFVIDKAAARALMRKLDVFSEQTQT